MKISRRDFLRLGGALAASICAPALALETRAGIPVLLYHDVSDDFRDTYTISPSLFAAQMEWLHGNGFRAIAVRDIVRPPENGKAVVLTFDDGYASYMEYAFPLFREYGFHSTINVIGSLAGRFLREGGNRPMLAWDEYRHILQSGRVDIGCHSFDLHSAAHKGALGVAGETLRQDLRTFRDVLRRETGESTDILAWPYGLYDAQRIAIAREEGFRYLLTSREASFQGSGDVLEIPRRNIDNLYDITSFGIGVES
ncbi:MAG: polysaccharide deacetylase family protein [Actinomycetota bacterium]